MPVLPALSGAEGSKVEGIESCPDGHRGEGFKPE